jgi:hypothetical protein
VMDMRIKGEVFKDQQFEEQYQDQAFEQGKYSLWFPCYLAIIITFYTYACV